MSISSAAAVFVQFRSPSRAYGGLAEEGRALASAIGALVVCLAVFLATGAVSGRGFEDAVADFVPGRVQELESGGMTRQEAEAAVAAEVESVRRSRGLEPYARLVERVLVALVAGAAAWGAERMGSGGAGLGTHLAASVIAQGAYVICSGVFFALATFTGIERLAAPGILSITGAPPAAPGSSLEAVFWISAGYLDLPSAVSVLLWGLGIAVSSGRKPAQGLRTAALVYLAGLALVLSLVVLEQPPGG